MVEERWQRLTDRTLAGLETCDPVYRPTNFWGPGVERLLADLRERGLESFKSWPEATFWFYPTYGAGLPQPAQRRVIAAAKAERPDRGGGWIRALLNGAPDARRDFDAARLAWDHSRWPFDLEGYAESKVGDPVQGFRLLPDSDLRWTKPYLNYLLCLAALSRHVDRPPASVLELGGGFGVLGEILMARDPQVRYVNCDIPPLLTVSSYYLRTLFGDRVLTYDDRVPDAGPVQVPASACLPNWRIGDLEGPFDVFVNSYSFQEMEPDVVEHYVDTVAGLGVRYAVSLNSREGKHVAASADEVGVKDPVTSSAVIDLFRARGYRLCATYQRPLVAGAGELAVLERE